MIWDMILKSNIRIEADCGSLDGNDWECSTKVKLSPGRRGSSSSAFEFGGSHVESRF